MSRAMVLHLSDIHVTSYANPILSRSQRIVDAVKNVELNLDAAVIVVTGDLAFAGLEGQYDAVWEFLEKTRDQLQVALEDSCRDRHVPVEVVAIPGNHDYNFSSPNALRDVAIKEVISNTGAFRDVRILDECLSVQSSFFLYHETLGSIANFPTYEPANDRLYYRFFLDINNRRLCLACFNSAWLSQRHEQQGEILLPEDIVPTTRDQDDVVIAMFHHPYNWMPPDAARAFRKRIEAYADIVLTGHEHDATARTQTVTTGEHNLYIEGGALQEAGSEESVFNLLIIDLEERKQKLGTFGWDGGRYVPLGVTSSLGDAFGFAWDEFYVTRLRQKENFELSEVMTTKLRDPSIPITHKSRGPLSLFDVFVYPDLEEVHYQRDRRGQVVRGTAVPTLLTGPSNFLILGETESGKSSLASAIFSELLGSGFVPVLLDGAEKHLTGDRLFANLVELFSEQYAPEQMEAFRQLGRSQRVIIVDDYHKLPLTPETKMKFVSDLCSFAGRVILFAEALVQEARDLFEPASRPDAVERFATMRILPLGHERRHELIEKWVALDEVSRNDSLAFAHRCSELTRTVDVVIGNNFLPSYAVFVLSVLQGAEALTPSDSRVGTYGAYYELFIRSALTRGRSPIQSNIILGYLSQVAHELFIQPNRSLDMDEYRRVHENFEVSFDLTIDLSLILQDLCNCQIFLVRDNSIQFRHKYVYYYFVASWLRDHITEPEVEKLVKDLANHLHIEDNSNILLFLVHLSRDPIIIDAILDRSRSLYIGVAPARFEEEVDFLVELGAGAQAPIFVDSDTKRNRREALERMDKVESANGSNKAATDEYQMSAQEESTEDTTDLVGEFVAATKTVEILGQILKNFPGTLESERKLEIARESYLLGLRSLADLLATLNEHRGVLLDATMEMVRDSETAMTEKMVEQKARDIIVGISEALAATLIIFVSRAVGSSELEKTYERIDAERSTPAVKLINTQIRLEHTNHFPEAKLLQLASDLAKRPFARTVLTKLVMMHFHLYPVDRASRQRSFAALGVKYTPALGAGSYSSKISSTT